MGRRHALHLVLALGTLAAASLSASIRQEEDWDLARPDPRVMLHPAQLSDLDSYDCATCHAEVVQEWAATAHGLSWADEHYQAAVQKKRRPQLCYGCHIPEPLLVAGLEKRPRPREQARQLGISCESCHEGPDGVMLGPRGEAVAAPYRRQLGIDDLHRRAVLPAGLPGIQRGFGLLGRVHRAAQFSRDVDRDHLVALLNLERGQGIDGWLALVASAMGPPIVRVPHV